MQGLNNNQIVLLTLLVSFVTSIATGIVTVTLMDQAPTGVTQTINRVVEKTVETVVPEGFKETVIEERVVVAQEEAVVNVIRSATSAFVSIYEIEEDVQEETEILRVPTAHGVVVSSEGKILVSGATLPSESYEVVTNTNVNLIGNVTSRDEENDLTLLELSFPEDFDGALSSLALSDATVALGQTAILLDHENVNIGFISSIVKDPEDGSIVRIKTNMTNQETRGVYVLVNSDKKVLGLYNNAEFISATKARDFLSDKEAENGEEVALPEEEELGV